MQHSIPAECGDCGRRAQRHTINQTGDDGVVDTQITFVECVACGRSCVEEGKIQNPVLNELQESLRQQADGLREDLTVLRDDGHALVVQDTSGRFQQDLKKMFGDDIEHVLHELARQHAPGDVNWLHYPPVTVLKRNPARLFDAGSDGEQGLA